MKEYDIAAYIWPSYTGDEPRSRIFWPEGYGEWETVKASKSKCDRHVWPRKPLWGYVNEADPYVMEMEIEAAAAHGYRMIPKVGGTRFVITSFDFDNEHIGIRSRHPDEKENFSKEDVISAYKPDYFDKMLVCTGAISLREKLKEICSAMVWQEEYKYDYASSLFKGVLIELYRLVTIKEKLQKEGQKK